MIETDENALFCDFAETYHIYDYMALPPITAARLASGLRENSRIRMKLSGYDVTLEQSLLAAAVDSLNVLVWQNTRDGPRGVNRPKSVLSFLTNKSDSKQVVGYQSAAEFEAAWKAANAKG